MKAIVNIGLRKVELSYTLKVKDLASYSHNERVALFGKDWEISFHNDKKKVTCKQVLWFDSFDEWQSTLLFNGKTIDFHYDYEHRKEFKTKKDWGYYIFQGYEYVHSEPQLYDKNVVTNVVVIF